MVPARRVGLFGKRGLCRGSSKPGPSQVLLPGQQHELRTLFFCREQHCVKLFCSDAVTHGNIPGDTSRAGETLIMCCCTRNSRLLQLCWVLLVIGLVLSASWKQKGGRFKEQKKKCFYFLKPKLPREISHPEHSLGGLQTLQQDWWLQTCLRLYGSAVLGSSISHKPQCLNLYFPASILLLPPALADTVLSAATVSRRLHRSWPRLPCLA